MIKKEPRNLSRLRRHARVREKISGSETCPRLCVFRSNSHLYASIIDDVKGHTLVSVSTIELKTNSRNVEAAKLVGETIAQKATKAKITKVVFDRSGYLYHGRVKSIADAARANGLQF